MTDMTPEQKAEALPRELFLTLARMLDDDDIDGLYEAAVDANYRALSLHGECERLRVELGRWVQSENMLRDRVHRAEALCARYRTALEEVACAGAPFDAKGTHSRRVQEIARAALAEQQEGGE